MAKTLVELENKLRVKYLIKPKKYYLFFGNQHPYINGEFHNVFESEASAVEFGIGLTRQETNYHINYISK